VASRSIVDEEEGELEIPRSLQWRCKEFG
jgi:hypothetical protein